ncbi:acetoacetate decarboxylase family protein [Marinobacter sp.]|uniref:acetoacetate decarboxylase family protein n=1 Tax=Marinobacter sp. TaxID=50741 RepID=UPI003567349B
MSKWQQDPFFQYPLTPFKTSEGNVDLPILYYDNSNFIAMWEVDYNKAEALLAGQPLKPVRFPGNKAVLTIAFYEYRETAVSSYNETGIALITVPENVTMPNHPWLSLYQPMDSRIQGLTVIDLPVTTKLACAAGREIWGFPKFVTPIEFSLTTESFTGLVQDPDGNGTILSLSGKPGLGIPGPQLDPLLYSWHNNQLLRTQVITRGGGKACLPGSIRAQTGNSQHPMATRLRSLDIENQKPKVVFHSHSLQLRLNPGAAIT